MKNSLKPLLGFGSWVLLTAIVGAMLTSFHQPFRDVRADGIVRLAGAQSKPWRMVHVLSGSCRCSQRVLRDMLQRPASAPSVENLVLMVDDGDAYLPESTGLLAGLQHNGIQVRHTTAAGMRAATGLEGVPLLVISGPGNKIAYAGGYGTGIHPDLQLLAKLQSGETPKQQSLIGCAVGERLKRRFDPFHLKYPQASQNNSSL